MGAVLEGVGQESTMFSPVTFILQLLASYGWYLVGLGVLCAYLYQRLRPSIQKWQEAREDAIYHKNPDIALARMEAIQRAREKQQQLLERASEIALEKQREREEKKRAEAAERLKKYGAQAGNVLGSDDDYLPLSGGGSTSSYKPPKRSACARGGCGK